MGKFKKYLLMFILLICVSSVSAFNPYPDSNPFSTTLHWKLDNDCTEEIINNDCTNSNGTYSTDTPFGTGYSIYYDGLKGSYLDSNFNNIYVDDPWTICFWFKADGTPDDNDHWLRAGTGSETFLVLGYSTPVYTFALEESGIMDSIDGIEPLTLIGWEHMCVRHESGGGASKLAFLINGNIVNKTEVNNGIVGHSKILKDISFMAHNVAPEQNLFHMKGWIDDVLIWNNTALTDAQILTLYQGNYSIPCTEDWTASYGACLINNSQLKTYTDQNACGTMDNLPADNGSYVACDSAIPPVITFDIVNESTLLDNFLQLTATTNNPTYCQQSDYYEYPTNDSEPPVISNPSPTGQIDTNNLFELKFYTNERADCKGELNIDKNFNDMSISFARNEISLSNYYYTYWTLEYGLNTVYVKCIDPAGNMGSFNWSFENIAVPGFGGGGGGGGRGGGGPLSLIHTWNYTDLKDHYTYMIWITCTDQFSNSKTENLEFYTNFCARNWVCNDHNASGNCISVIDLNNCGVAYTGDYSEFPLTTYNDSVLGDGSDINSNETINTLIEDIPVDNWFSMTSTLDITFKQGNNILAEFSYNFSDKVLNLSNISVERQNGAGATKGYILVTGIQQEETKTLYLHNVSPNFNWVCIKDTDTTNISEITDNCQGTDEYHVQCNNQTSSGYMCEDLGNNVYRITGLQHSAVTQMEAPPTPSSPSGGGGGGGGGSSGCIELWSCTAWTGCSEGKQTRTCTDAKKCRTEKNKPAERKSCAYAYSKPVKEEIIEEETEEEVIEEEQEVVQEEPQPKGFLAITGAAIGNALMSTAGIIAVRIMLILIVGGIVGTIILKKRNSKKKIKKK